jgi:cell division protein FtsW
VARSPSGYTEKPNRPLHPQAVAIQIRYLLPFIDPSAKTWSADARMMRWLTLLWLAIGLAVMFSASYTVADADQSDGLYYFKRQIIWAWIGLSIFNMVIHAPLRYILGMAHWGLIGCLGLILLTLVPGLGHNVNGATRWLVLGPVPLQPSELIKPFLILQGARVFGKWQQLSTKTRGTWLAIFGVVLLLILKQPNLSTAALCGMLLWLIALAAGLPYRYLGGTAFGGILLATLSVTINEYQRRRIMSFTNPWADSQGDGYQLVQSLLAIGSGEFWGHGFGMSQQKMFYLPIQDTDFIFAVFAEEFGFIGGIVLLLMLAAYATMGLRVALKAQRNVHQLVAIGSVVLLIGQAILNVGVATGALPTTGLPFPMFSYGGNSLMASLFAAGMIIRVARESSEADVVSMDVAEKAGLRGRSTRS